MPRKYACFPGAHAERRADTFDLPEPVYNCIVPSAAMKEQTFARLAAPLLVPTCFAISTLIAGAAPSKKNFVASKPTNRARSAQAARPGARSAARPVTRRVAQLPRGKYEPTAGAYLGAALDTSGFSKTPTRSNQIASAQRSWEQQAGKKHALYLHFIQFPHPDGSFPSWDNDPKGWGSAQELSDAASQTGASPVLTLEPQVLQPFYTDWRPGSVAYEATAAFARAAGAWNRPLFIRFAHEMNGTWYPWSEWNDKNRNQRRDPGEDTGNTPERYRRAYRNVALLFRKYAPNAALVWCPNSGLLGGARRDPYRPWYPGDDVVDWVGMDSYERGWTLPMPGARLWGGQFAYNLRHDAADDPKTPANESVDFYATFVDSKNKPMMLCETGATLSYRTDLSAQDRATMTNGWKAGWWNNNEYGWMQAVYGTSVFKDQPILHPIDRAFPRLKAIIWFQIAKREWIPAQKTENGKTSMVWFDNTWADYRVGGGSEENVPSPFLKSETELYRKLTSSNYFLSSIQR